MSEVQTLARGLRILDLLAAAQDGLSTTELTAELKIDEAFGVNTSPWLDKQD